MLLLLSAWEAELLPNVYITRLCYDFQVIVLPDDGLPVLLHPIAAVCAENTSCYFSYSADSAHTPQLESVDVSINSSLLYMVYYSLLYFCPIAC